MTRGLFSSLRARLILAVGGVTGLVLLSLQFATYRIFEHAVLEDLRGYSQFISRAYADRAQMRLALLRTRLRDLVALSASGGHPDTLPAGQLSLWEVSRGGRTLQYRPGRPPQEAPAAPPPPHTSPDSPQWSLIGLEAVRATCPFAAPGASPAWAAVQLPLTVLLEDDPDLKLEQTGYAFLADDQGRVLTRDGLVSQLDAELLRAPPGALVEGVDPRGRPAIFIVHPIQPLGLHLGVMVPRDEVFAEARQLRLQTALLTSIGMVVLLTTVTWLARRIADPLHDLAQAAAEISRGNLEAELPEREVNQLGRTFGYMLADLKTHVQNFQKARLVHQRLAREVDLARELQQAILPGAFPALRELRLAGRTRPAQEVGGDFYDYFVCPDGWVALVTADISGEGVPAAMYAALTRSTLKSRLQAGLPAEQALSETNDVLCLDNPEAVFVTTVVARVEPASGEVHWASAGHPAPLLATGPLPGPVDPPLGLKPGHGFRLRSARLAPGQVMLLYTDGLSEAAAPDQSLFGLERLRGQLREVAGPEQLLERIWSAVDAFAAGQPQADDMTAVALLFQGGGEPALRV